MKLLINKNFLIIVFCCLLVVVIFMMFYSSGDEDIFEASLKGNFSRVKILVEENPQFLETTAYQGLNPLILACIEGHEKIVDFMLEHKVDVNFQATKSGETALMMAAAYGHLSIFDKLIANGAVIDLKTNGNEQAIHAAARTGECDIIKRLIALGVDINARDILGRTPLWYAAFARDSDAVRQIILADPDLNTVDCLGDTALNVVLKEYTNIHPQVRNSWKLKNPQQEKDASVEVVKILLEAGIDTSVQNKEGEDALCIVKKTGNEMLINMLQKPVSKSS